MKTPVTLADPNVLRNATAAAGIARRALAEAFAICGTKPSLARIEAAIGQRASICNAKSRARVLGRLHREFGPCGIGYLENHRPPGILYTFWTADPNGEFGINIACLMSSRGGRAVAMVNSIGRLSKHALQRFVQRAETAPDDVTNEAILAAARALTLVSMARDAGGLDGLPDDATVLVPAGCGVAAVVAVKDAAIITFLQNKDLGPARSDVIEGLEIKSFMDPAFSVLATCNLLSAKQVGQIRHSARVLAETKRLGGAFAAREAELTLTREAA